MKFKFVHAVSNFVKKFHAVKKDVQIYLSKFSFNFGKSVKKFIRAKPLEEITTCIELIKVFIKCICLSIRKR